jgi:hypothetical protein
MQQPLPSFIRAGLTDAGGVPQSVNPRQFRALCSTAARVTDGVVLGFDPPPFDAIKNFSLAVFQCSNSSGDPLVFLLMNHHAPLLACASAQNLHLSYSFAFIDAPELTAPFAPFFHILKKQELEHPWMWTERELAFSLSPPEIKEITYWKPRTVGEAIFNFWD